MAEGRNRPSSARRLAVALLAVVVASMGVVAVAGAESSTEATIFGADGIATQSLGVHLERNGISSVSARPDGGLVVQRSSGLESFSADGSPEPTAPPRNAPEGRSFPAAGGNSFVLGEGKLTRVNADGTVDTSFGEGGSVEVSGASSVGELTSGKVVVFGIEFNGTNRPENTGVVTVLNVDGSTAPGATVSRSLPSISEEMPVREMIATPQGGLLIVDSAFLLELGANGSPNPGFGQRGVADQSSTIAGAHFLSGGSIEAATLQYISSEQREVPAVLRLTAAGEPEGGFGTEGVHVLELKNWWDVDSVSWGPDGSAVIGGREVATGCSRKQCEETPVLIGVDPAGNLDTGFGEGGVSRLTALAGQPGAEGYASGGVTALTRRPDGSVAVAGNAAPNGSIAFIAALTPRGALVSSFGEGGIVRLSESVPATERISGLVPVAGGKLLATGWTDVGVSRQAMLVRYDADGSLDPSFGNGSGWLSLAEYGRESGGIAVRGGAALVAPYRYPGSVLLMVHTEDGLPVSSFGSDGLVRLPRRQDYAGALAFASDGDPIVLDGAQSPEDTKVFGLQRYRRDGKPDRAFGKRGQVSLRVPDGGLRDRAMVTARGGRVLVGGYVGESFVVGRLLPDGRLDPHFGSHGWSVTRVPGRVDSMSMVTDGSRILLAGTIGESGHHGVALVRLRADGRPDKGFGHRGIRLAKTEAGWGPTAILPAPAGITVLLARGIRPVLTFTPGGTVRRRTVAGHPQKVWQVQGTVSEGHLIVGWSPLDGFHEVADYYLSSLPLEP
ncbi:MAG TPA: delta-60 repeat domain-containing protein [Solirubrobacterales bacterium]|nr:delta-60 repeat domain-containing protein [Solirubrobacterales bacterium]